MFSQDSLAISLTKGIDEEVMTIQRLKSSGQTLLQQQSVHKYLKTMNVVAGGCECSPSTNTKETPCKHNLYMTLYCYDKIKNLYVHYQLSIVLFSFFLCALLQCLLSEVFSQDPLERYFSNQRHRGGVMTTQRLKSSGQTLLHWFNNNPCTRTYRL